MTSIADSPQTLDLHIESLTRTILKLAVPSVLESMLSTVVYLVDSVLIGRLNDAVALATVGLSSTLMWATEGLFQAISFGALAMVARFWGQKDFEAARRVAGQALILSVLAAVAVMALLIPSSKLFFIIMGGESEVIRLGGAYITILLAASPASFCLSVANSILRATGDTRKPMVITGLMNLWNVALAYTLIFGLGPIPAMGLRGAAWATSSAWVLGSIVALGVLFSSRTPIHLRWRHLWRWEPGLIGRIVRLSLPSVGETVISRFGFLLFMRIISALGTVALAAHQLALSVESLAYMPGWGLAIAAAALVGQALGAEKHDVAEKGIQRTLLMGNGAMLLIGLAFVAFGPAIVGFYGVTQVQLVSMATLAVRISALELFGLCSLMILSGCLRGAGDTRTPMVVTLAGTLLFRVPTTYLFAVVLDGGLKGVWLATAVDWSMRALIMLFLYMRGDWKRIAI
ncbi:MAG: MATE family efflux transporter [Chloroflexota bacterium]